MMTNVGDFEHSGRVIRDEIRIDAPPDAVYQAWSDPETVTSWFVRRMEGKMEAGEEVTWHWDESDPGMTQRVLVADPPHRLVTSMELPQGVSYLEVTIEQRQGHSVLHLVQSGFGVGPEWDDQYEGMLSGWMMALAVLKFFLERYMGRRRREIVILQDAPFDREEILALQRTDSGLARWLARSPTTGSAEGEPVRVVLEGGRTLTGTVLRTTSYETLWSWEEMEGVVELKAFRGQGWGSKVGLRISSWMADAGDLAELRTELGNAVRTLASILADGT